MGAELERRIEGCLQAGSLELETFVRLIGVVETTDVPTASIVCEGRARLFVNPEFVALRCERDEHLYLLVMHELWHVLLGHGGLFDERTHAHDIALDALINAGLSRQHPGPEFRGFFEAINPADEFPWLLLRAPVGWPHEPHYDVPGPTGTREILRRLYPPPGERVVEPLYREIVDLIATQPTSATGTLLGDHSSPAQGRHGNPMNDPLLRGVLQDVAGSWGPELAIGGAAPAELVVPPGEVRARARRVLAQVVREASRPCATGVTARRRRRGSGRSVLPMPSAYDRTAPARSALSGLTPVLHAQPVPRPRCNDRSQALAYLDVSGSMVRYLPVLLAVLKGPVSRGEILLQQFSTEVAPLTLAELKRGEVMTGGTSIDRVLQDLADRPNSRALIVSDGMFTVGDRQLIVRLAQRGVKAWLCLPEGVKSPDLGDLSHEVVRLPELL